MTLNRIKVLVIAGIAFLVVTIAGFNNQPLGTPAAAADTATTYKAKCAMCHTPKAEKFFDPARTDEEHVQAILKGKKGEKPPYMPGFEEKGMTPEEARALAQFMRTLRTPAN